MINNQNLMIQNNTNKADQESISPKSALPDEQKRGQLRKYRAVKDLVSKLGVSTGGLFVVIALALIFVFLFIEVLPMLKGSSVEIDASYSTPLDQDEIMLLDMDRYQEIGVSYYRSGKVVFFDIQNGRPVKTVPLELPSGVYITSYAAGEPRTDIKAVGLSDGTALVLEHRFNVLHSGGVRTITPELSYPYGQEPFVVDENRGPLSAIGIQRGSRGTVVAATTDDSRLLLVKFDTRVSFMTGEQLVEVKKYSLGKARGEIENILVTANHFSLFVTDSNGRIYYYDITRPEDFKLEQSLSAVHDQSVKITTAGFILGTSSIIIGRSDGSVSQYFLVRDDRNIYQLNKIRDFQAHSAPVISFTPEYYRKGFFTGDADGFLAAHYPASHRTVLNRKISDHPLTNLALSPVQRLLFAVDASNNINLLRVFNPHPEVSIKALWQKVWYEGRSQPDYTWQSSSATDDFEPKFSQIPLTLGTIKAAFYAMLLAMPLAIMGAIYTAYFMTPRMRALVKPSIEIMEALPTVILGFLAGLWLAPFVENHLPAIFSIIILMPVVIIFFAWLWSNIPARIRKKITSGWEAALLVPVVIFTGWLCIFVSPFVEVWFFGGSARQWLTDVGITYDQRNALVVGLAMGFAVIPTIFSIAEDAIFSVPRHLTEGSLALGATRWQTVTRVVLLTASPGIFSAVMIGFGRAVGETMIVLMATGNSPVINFNIFEGMRTLSANIAVELTETAVGGTHYRILFLSALLLFILTFILNTAAEIVRQRLRRKYSSL
jgi:phosphate transport system permease protein